MGPVCIRVDCQPYPRVDMDPGVIPEEFLSQSPPLIISQTLLKIRRMSQCVHLEPIFHVRCHVRGYSDDTPPQCGSSQVTRCWGALGSHTRHIHISSLKQWEFSSEQTSMVLHTDTPERLLGSTVVKQN